MPPQSPAAALPMEIGPNGAGHRHGRLVGPGVLEREAVRGRPEGLRGRHAHRILTWWRRCLERAVAFVLHTAVAAVVTYATYLLVARTHRDEITGFASALVSATGATALAWSYAGLLLGLVVGTQGAQSRCAATTSAPGLAPPAQPDRRRADGRAHRRLRHGHTRRVLAGRPGPADLAGGQARLHPGRAEPLRRRRPGPVLLPPSPARAAGSGWWPTSSRRWSMPSPSGTRWCSARTCARPARGGSPSGWPSCRCSRCWPCGCGSRGGPATGSTPGCATRATAGRGTPCCGSRPPAASSPTAVVVLYVALSAVSPGLPTGR